MGKSSWRPASYTRLLQSTCEVIIVNGGVVAQWLGSSGTNWHVFIFDTTPMFTSLITELTQILKLYETSDRTICASMDPFKLFFYAYNSICHKRCQHTNTPLLQAKANSLSVFNFFNERISCPLKLPWNSPTCYYTGVSELNACQRPLSHKKGHIKGKFLKRETQTPPHLLAQTPCSYLSITNTAQQLYSLVRKEKEKQRGEGQS